MIQLYVIFGVCEFVSKGISDCRKKTMFFIRFYNNFVFSCETLGMAVIVSEFVSAARFSTTFFLS